MRLAFTILLALASLIAFAAVAAAEDATVRVGDADESGAVEYLEYYPSTLVIRAGDTVTWKAAAATPHTVTQLPPGPGGFDSSPALTPELFAAEFGPGGFLLAGQSFSHTFDKNGTFAYHCKIHEAMQGTVRVVEAGSEPAASGIVYATAGWGSGTTTVNLFAPAELVVEEGTVVVWTNMHSAEPHTVTAMPEGMEHGDAHGEGMGMPEGELEFDSSPVIGKPADAFFSPEGVMAQGLPNFEFEHTFDEAGTYEYFCKLHPGMVGTVVVVPKEESAGAASGGLPSATADTKSTPLAPLGLVVAGIAAAGWVRRRR